MSSQLSSPRIDLGDCLYVGHTVVGKMVNLAELNASHQIDPGFSSYLGITFAKLTVNTKPHTCPCMNSNRHAKFRNRLTPHLPRITVPFSSVNPPEGTAIESQRAEHGALHCGH